MHRRGLLVVLSGLWLFLAAGAAADPVDNFIAAADSVSHAGDDALAAYIDAHGVLVGAAVGTLLDVAFQVAEQGNTAGEKENVDFAEKVATIYAAHGGTGAPLDLVKTYRGWTGEQRATRKRAIDLEQQAAQARDARDLDKALSLYDQARTLYESIDDRHSIAVNYGSLGVVNWYRGDMDAVRESYNKALEARRAVDDAILVGKTLNGLGSTNLRTGNYDEAVTWYEQAIDLRRRTGDEGGLGTSLTYLGNCYFQMNRLVDARDCFEEALPVLERTGRPAQMIEILNSVANLNSEMGRLRAADDAYRRAIDIATKAKSPVDEASCRINLADNYQRAGKYGDALDQLDLAGRALETQPEPYRLADLHHERGQVYLNMGEVERAREELMDFRKRAEALNEPTYTVNAQLMTAQVYGALGAYGRGIEAARQAIATATLAGMSRMVRQAESVAARLEARAGNAAEALTHWQNALAIDERDKAQSRMLESRVGVAGALALEGDFDEARRRYREILPVARDAGLWTFLAVAHQGIAHTYETTNPDSARVHYEAALSYYEQSLEDIGGAEASTGFLSGERRFIYEEVARYYATLYGRGEGDVWSERAFHTIESAKARGLLDMLRSAQAYQSSDAEDALLDSLYTMRAAGNANREAIERLQKRYLALRDARVEKTVGALQTAHSVATLDDVRKGIDKGTVVISYALGDTASMAWTVDRKRSALYTLPDRARLSQEVQQLRDAIGRPGAGDERLRATARDLYKELLAPMEDMLHGARRVILIPDGVLFELPFEVLLAEDPEAGAAWADLPYVAKRYPIVYAPSASTYLALEHRKESRRFDLDLLALGDPAYSKASGLAPLPYTREEVLAISDDFKASRKEILIGADANETAFRVALKEHHPRIVHLAAHGLVDPHDPSASSVALCEPAGGADDGYLHTLEITSLPLDVGLVVISACESARGQLSRSEGVVGLSRAFVASGAEGVVASLWSVSDRSTAALMKEFYDRMIGKKEPAAQALADARLALMKDPEYAHPFHWSPFIAIGMESAPW